MSSSILLCFTILLFLGSSSVHGASLGEHRSSFQRGNVRPLPNVDMLKALEYIESLRQKTTADAQQRSPVVSVGNHAEAERLRAAMMRPDFSPTQRKDEEEDTSEELLQAVLSTLRQTEKAFEPVPLRLNREQGGTRGRQRVQQGIAAQREHPLMFEDEEEEEEDGNDRGEEGLKHTNENVEEKYTPQTLAMLQSLFDQLDTLSVHKRQEEVEEGEGSDGVEEVKGQGPGLKRTNENMEETYTPQTLAMLQSVFDQLDTLSVHKRQEKEEEEEEEEEVKGSDGGEEVKGQGPGPKHLKRTNENVEETYTPQTLAMLQSLFDQLDTLSVHKRQEEEEEEEEEDGDEDDGMFSVRSFEDTNTDPALDWGPLRDQDGEDEDDADDKQDVDRELDYSEEDEGGDAEEEEDETYPVKRSGDPDDVAKLMDYYLLQILEKTEEEETQRRDLEEEERLEKRAAQENLPQTLYRLMQISQKYRIPPKDLLDTLRSARVRNQDRLRKVNKFSRIPSRLSQVSNNRHAVPERKFYGRRLRQKSPQQLRMEEILRILEDDAPVREQTRYRSSLTRPVDRLGESTRRRFPQDDDNNNMWDEEELHYLLPAQNRRPSYRTTSLKRDDGSERSTSGSFQHMIQDYFHHMDDKSPNEQRRFDEDSENQAVMKLLSPETTDGNDAKTVLG